jgi:hypothetical protein
MPFKKTGPDFAFYNKSREIIDNMAMPILPDSAFQPENVESGLSTFK